MQYEAFVKRNVYLMRCVDFKVECILGDVTISFHVAAYSSFNNNASSNNQFLLLLFCYVFIFIYLFC